jgi:hypothetical protein
MRRALTRDRHRAEKAGEICPCAGFFRARLKDVKDDADTTRLPRTCNLNIDALYSAIFPDGLPELVLVDRESPTVE